MNSTMFSELQGKTLSKIIVGKDDGDEIEFITSDGERYLMSHNQDCCENVTIEDINGDLNDVIGSPILVAEERSNSENPPEHHDPESFTWTFYELRTIKGSVTIRWYGSSNGFYSETVDFYKS